MQALYKTARGVGNLELREAPVPSPRANEVLLEIKAAGICGTDIHIKHDEFPYWPPVILGHEFSGVVVEAGSTVADYRPGDRVVAEPHTGACGKCALCRTGHIEICESKRSPGWGINGAFARYLAMPEHLLHRIPDSLSDREAALIEPAANVVQDVLERGLVQAGDRVVVLGPGPIGLMAVMAARAAGAASVALVGAEADLAIRLPLGSQFGADAIIVSGRQDVVEAVADFTGGRGADVVVEASGAPAAIASLPHLVRVLGRITVIGMTGKEQVPFPWDRAVWKACTVVFSRSTGYTAWERTIALAGAGLLDLGRLITHAGRLEEWERIFDEVESQRAVKALLIP